MNDFTVKHYTTTHNNEEQTMITPTKRATRRLAVSLAIITALATSGAWAETSGNTYLQNSKTMSEDWTVTGFLSIAYNKDDQVLDVGSYYLSVGGNLIVGHNRRGTINLGSGSISARSTAQGTYIGFDNGSTGIVNVDGGTFTIGGTKYFYVGHNGTGTLNLNSGSVVSTNEVHVGEGSTGNGTVNVTGGSLEAKSVLYVGNSGTGTMTVNDGGSATVNGAFYVGNNGTGTLNLNGGTVDAKGLLYLGNIANSTGTLTISDGGSATVSGALYVGNNGTGTMTVSEGGSATVNGAFYVGNNGTGTLNLNGGMITAKNDFKINKGTFNGTAGTLELTSSGNSFTVGSANNTGIVDKDGGDWSCYNLYIGNGSNVTGSFTHDGGTLIVAPSSYPFIIGGNSGTGEFTLNGGTVTVGSGNVTSLGFNNTGNGTLNLNGGTLITKQVNKNTSSGTCVVVFNGGTLKANAVDGNGLIKLGVTVEVGSNGGTIDSGNLGINVGAAIADASGAAGKMRFKGGNQILLNGANTYTGGTIIELGTKVKASDERAKNTIVGKLVVDCSEFHADASDVVVFEYSAGGLTADNVNVTCENCGDGTEAKVSDDGKKILVDFKARPWATVSGNTTWNALETAAGGAPASDASVSVKMAGDYTLEIDKDVMVGQIAFSNGDGSTLVIADGTTLTVDNITGITNIVNYGTLVKTGEGTVAWPFDIVSTGVTVVSNGTLKVAYRTVNGTAANPAQIVRVKSGAKFDMNGVKDNVVNVVLEDGAYFVNTGTGIDNQTQQAKSITLEGNATASATSSFGLRSANGEGMTTLALGSNTLTLDVTSAFWLVGTTITGSGVINVANGTLQCVRYGASGEDCTVSVGANGTFRIEAGLTLTVKNFVNGGHINTDGHGTLAVTGTFTPGSAAINKLTLADGATVKASATTSQTVLEAFSASGTVTIDASEISEADLDAATDERIPVLTVPTANKGGTWTVSNPPIDGCRVKWIDNGDGTSTLYLTKPTGLMVIIR